MSRPPETTPSTQSRRERQRLWAVLIRAIARLELLLDRVVWGLRRRFGRLGPLSIIAYRGFGTDERAVVRGRVLEASVLERSLPHDTRLRSIRRMLRRFNSRELPEASVRVVVGDGAALGRTDAEGYFDVPVEASALAGVGAWKSTEVEVVAAPVRGLIPVRAAVDILVPEPSAEIGVVSDIDDTVLQSHVTQKLKLIWVTLSGSAFTRMPFEGTTELYRALAAGSSGHANNPVFYVSKSPWNLYDFLVDFLDFHQLPRGPLLLRDIGVHEAPPLDHKLAAVCQLLETYPQLPFVLIGDSGERDPDIYLDVAAQFPGRVRAIYIRDLGQGRGGSADDREARRERAKSYGVEMLWVDHARLALEHAQSRSWVRAAAGRSR